MAEKIVHLKVVKSYTCRDLVFVPGENPIEVNESLAEFLLRDAPGSFEVFKPKAEARVIEAPPADKMIRPSASRRK